MSYRPKTVYKYNISIQNLWYWISPESIEVFRFFEIFNFLKICSKLFGFVQTPTYSVLIFCSNGPILRIHTEFSENRSIWILDEFEFVNFFPPDIKFFKFDVLISNMSTFWNSMWPWNLLCEKAKIKQHTSSKNERCKTG